MYEDLEHDASQNTILAHAHRFFRLPYMERVQPNCSGIYDSSLTRVVLVRDWLTYIKAEDLGQSITSSRIRFQSMGLCVYMTLLLNLHDVKNPWLCLGKIRSSVICVFIVLQNKHWSHIYMCLQMVFVY